LLARVVKLESGLRQANGRVANAAVVYAARVTNANDPDKCGRVRVAVGNKESGWSPVVGYGALYQKGCSNAYPSSGYKGGLLKVGDEVLFITKGGDFNSTNGGAQTYVLGVNHWVHAEMKNELEGQVQKVDRDLKRLMDIVKKMR
jgi:hypothetical protein